MTRWSCSIGCTSIRALGPPGHLRRHVGRVSYPSRAVVVAEDPIRHMWDQFRAIGPIEKLVIDTSAIDSRATAKLVIERMAAGDLRFPGVGA